MSSRIERLEYLEKNCPTVLPVREQSKLVNEVIKDRLDNLLPQMMQQADLDMWLIICNEDNHDPVFDTLLPFDSWAPILQIFAFCKNADGSVDRYNISMTDMNQMFEVIWRLKSEDDQWETLRKLIEKYNPKKIGINESNAIWAADGLTSALKQKLVKILGTEYANRLVSAEELCVLWLEILSVKQIELYEQVAAICHFIIHDTYTSETITPGVTTCEDLRWHFWQTANDLGLPLSFTPYFNLQRSDKQKEQYPLTDGIIRHGDLLHCDVGVVYLRLLSDMQEMAYLPQPGEEDAPEGMHEAFAMGNKLQDIMEGEMKLGRTGNEILNATIAEAEKQHISHPLIHTHAIGYYLHEPGPLIGLPWEQKDTEERGEVKLVNNSGFSIELGVRYPCPGWDNQLVGMALEQDAVFTGDGLHYFDGRQTKLHIIK